MAWWREARFGMFIHWGPYAVLGGVYDGHRQKRGGAEWIMNRCKIPVAEYQRFAAQFNPTKYDPESWVLLARQAGMKYIVITSKHHDGFAMFKSAASPFNIVDHTPYKKDVIDALAKACRKHGMKLGFYYSQAQDWNNPGGSAARKEMAEGWDNPRAAEIDAYTAAHKGHWDPAQETRDMAGYIDQVAVPQVKELLNNYGDIAIIWWDTPTGMTGEFAKKFDDILRQHPQVITNDRLKRPDYPGDHKTPEQKIPNPEELDGKDWEACMTLNGSWGYKSWDNNWKSAETLVQNLIRITSMGGNYLLNIGPMATGEIPQPSIDRLREVGAWMKANGESIHGTQKSPAAKPAWGYITRKDDAKTTTLYLHVLDWPADGKLTLAVPCASVSATLLATGAALKTGQNAGATTIALPTAAPDKIASVIKLTLTEKLPGEKSAATTTATAAATGKSFDIVD
jgi:alpha-L-fucosidase